MADARLYFENQLPAPIYVFLQVDANKLMIRVSKEPWRDAARIEPGQRISFLVNDAVRGCIRNRSLAFEGEYHFGGARSPKLVCGRSDECPDGPLFQFWPADSN